MADRHSSSLELLLKERVERLIGEEFRQCEAAIELQLRSSVDLISEVGCYVAQPGGKRLRPILLLLSAKLCGGLNHRAVALGCVVELLHTATLIHDDVVDQARLRRGRPSANARYGGDASILMGDHLYSKSFALLVDDNDHAVMDTLARATVSMTEAELFQLERKRQGHLSEEDYLQIITQKTASFISACCRIGALLGKGSSERVNDLAAYGLNLGIAFQIVDDALDFVADEAKFGKAVGTDLREGTRTLPLITALARADPDEREIIKRVLGSPRIGELEIENVVHLVTKYDGAGYALDRAREYVRRARGHLEGFEPSEEREALTLITEYVLERES